MKKFLPLMAWTICAATAIAFAGCARSENASQTIASRPPEAGSTPITRREEVPNGIETPFGLTIPKGFQINLFAEGLTNPRRIAIAPGATPQKYDVFVAESKANRIRILRDANGDGKAEEKFVFSDQLNQPYGIAFWNDWIYVGNTDAIVRLPYDAGQTATDQPPQHISGLTESGYNQHWTRNLLFSRDGKKLYVTVGSSCNTCEEDDPQRAAISVMNPDGSDRRIFASGLRNPVGMAWDAKDNLWTVVNERDWVGPDMPPDYLTKVKDGGFYGWPYAYVTPERDIKPDSKFGEKNPQKVEATIPATVPVQAHSAALGVAFYPEVIISSLPDRASDPPNHFPLDYMGDAFLAFHGSWNRDIPTGYKIVRVHFSKDKIEVSDFVSGFLKNGKSWGRPVDVQIAPDGSLLFSDDGGGKIWRVSRAK
jgi:glucose/arabinose dehydrogenase